jgi:hypothetical protein
MTTKPPSRLHPFPDNSLEKIVYTSIEEVATLEPNDRARLGFSIIRWLEGKNGTLEDIIFQSHIRLKIPVKEAVDIVRKSLTGKGITLPS